MEKTPEIVDVFKQAAAAGATSMTLRLLALAATFLSATLPAAAEKPNIVFILADDMGYGDVRALNPAGKIATPNLDSLAAAGMVFTDAHSSSAVCTPSRYSLLTGRYNWRSRLQSGVIGGLSPRLIEPGRLTVASLLKRHGYSTACVGKWHLGMDWALKEGRAVADLSVETHDQVWNVDYARPITNGPTSVGFDEYFGVSGALDMAPYTFIENDRVTETPTEDRVFPIMLGRKQSGFTRKGPAAPGFDAAEVLAELTRRAIGIVRHRADAAKKGEPFFLYLPLASPHTPILPTSEWQGKSGLNPYADFVMQTDAAVGEILAELDRCGLTENTLVMFASDNGCSPLAQYDELVPKGHNPSHVFRGHKAQIYEGGHRVPFMARWPARVKPRSSTDRLVCLTDFMATCAEILGVKLPDEAGEDSVSFLPTLLGKNAGREDLVSHSANGSFAIREGAWKLCLCSDSGGWKAAPPGRNGTSNSPPVQLFHVATDIGEQDNVQARRPDVVAELAQQLEKYIADGRSTPGTPQRNSVAVEIWKADKQIHQPSKVK